MLSARNYLVVCIYSHRYYECPITISITKRNFSKNNIAINDEFINKQLEMLDAYTLLWSLWRIAVNDLED